MMANDDAGSGQGQDRKKGNLRLALILASIALVFLLGFVGKMMLLGK
jgi:hypothetical protein